MNAIGTGADGLTNVLVSSAAEALFFMDAEGRVLYVNPAGETLFGWTRDEYGDRRLHDVIHYQHPDGRPYPMETCPLGRVMRTGTAAIDHEDVFLHRDGSLVPVLCSNAPVVTDGAISGAVLVVRDATEHRRAIDRLEARTRALAEADRRKDEFIALLAHELRNPAAAILTAAEVLRRAPAGQPQAGVVEIIYRQARLLEDLLDVARMTRGKIRIERRRHDLADIARTEFEDHHALLTSRGLHGHFAASPARVWVEGDETRLAQVVGNLLVNASKFTPPGRNVWVTVAAAEGRASLSVRDEGVGLSPDLLAQVFEPFVQADASLHRSEGGLGVGLTLVRGLVELHGGSVVAHSDGPDRGATFTAFLPLAAAPADAPAVVAIQPRGPASRILLIEDLVDLAALTADMLRDEGHEVIVAHDGAQALTLAAACAPDVIVCDLGLPGIDGFELARRLRATPALQRVRLIALSGYAGDGDRQRAREAGFDAHLAKPATPAALSQVLGGRSAP